MNRRSILAALCAIPAAAVASFMGTPQPVRIEVKPEPKRFEPGTIIDVPDKVMYIVENRCIISAEPIMWDAEALRWRDSRGRFLSVGEIA